MVPPRGEPFTAAALEHLRHRKHHPGVLLGWTYDPRIEDVRPKLFRSEEEVRGLVFDKRCVQNLTNYLPTATERHGKAGIVLKGCDGRSLVTLLAEHRVDRNKIVAIAVSCDGVAVEGRPAGKCADCATRISPIADETVGEAGETGSPEFARLAEIEKMSPDERWAFFSEQFSRCNRCYACRQTCPLCYCDLCLVDRQEPKWIEPSAKVSSNTMWHLVRAYHLAGRCSDCGECERACPQGLPLRLLNNALEKSVIEMFGVRPGTEPDETPPLVALSTADSDEILGGDL